MKRFSFCILGLLCVFSVLFVSCSDDDYETDKALTNAGKKAVFVPSEPVDLGLSVGWASYNVGAGLPEDYGCYYAWGETEEKDSYYWDNYKYGNGTYEKMTKYNRDDSIISLEPEDDVAHVKWGGKWRIPSVAEFKELIDSCDWTKKKLNGVDGYEVRGCKYHNRALGLCSCDCEDCRFKYIDGDNPNFWELKNIIVCLDDSGKLLLEKGDKFVYRKDWLQQSFTSKEHDSIFKKDIKPYTIYVSISDTTEMIKIDSVFFCRAEHTLKEKYKNEQEKYKYPCFPHDGDNMYKVMGKKDTVTVYIRDKVIRGACGCACVGCSNSIFIPFAGCYDGIAEQLVPDMSTYWSREYILPNKKDSIEFKDYDIRSAYCLHVSSVYANPIVLSGDCPRFFGRSVRPVYDEALFNEND